MKRIFFKFIKELAGLLLGGTVYGVALRMFIVPYEITFGGATGIATTLNRLFGCSIGAVIILINVPLFILAVKVFSLKGGISAVIGALFSAAAADIFAFLPMAKVDMTVASVFGGAMMGAGSGMMLSIGYATGGSDLAVQLLLKKFHRISAGRMIMIIDITIIAVSVALTGNYDSIIYSLIATGAYCVGIDYVMGGSERSTLAFIVSDMSGEIARRLMDEIGHGVTDFTGNGKYSGQEKKVILSVIRRREEKKLKEIVFESDKSAFLTFLPASGVFGLGFKTPE